MTALLALLARVWPYIACLGIGLGTGGYLEKNRWEARYSQLQASTEQRLADAQEAGRKALQSQLEQFQVTTANNAKVINDLQNQTQQAQADSARDRDLVQRLLHAAAERDPRYHTVPEASHQPGAPPAGQTFGDGRLDQLLRDTADECRANIRQLNALRLEIQPQL